MRLKVWYIVLLLSIMSAVCWAEKPYRTQIFKESIKTLLVHPAGVPIAYPVMELGGEGQVQISFDDLANEEKSYRYTIIHCNADWTPSVLNQSEYIRGFTDNFIEEYQYSFNTAVNYVHYDLYLPNRNVAFKVSGNYTVVIYEAGKKDKPVATAAFSLVEHKVDLKARVATETEIDVRRHHQEVNFILRNTEYKIDNPQLELKTVIRQNGRIDNERRGIKPTFIKPTYLEYDLNEKLVFEAGNEFRHFDASSVKYNGYGIYSIDFFRPFYHVTLFQDKMRSNEAYVYDPEQNGFSFIRRQESDEANYATEAEYTVVHFSVPSDDILLTGKVFLNSNFTNNLFTDDFEMSYNFEKKVYEKALLLKQGYHNYQYLLRPANTNKGSYMPFEGNFWETENSYQIFIYHRPFAEIYDKLIGYVEVKSRN